MFRSAPSTSTSSLSSSEDSHSPKHFESHGAGTHKVHYQPQQEWDFIADTDERPVDVSLVLPHYRARNQPTGHRMSMYIHSRAEIKSTICRQSSRTPFFLSVHSSSMGTAPVTLFLPSDFSGNICLSSTASKISFSAGFTNHILPHVRFTRISNFRREKVDGCGEDGSDEVEIHTTGHIMLRMWDVSEGAPERIARETWRKMCRRATSSKSLRTEQQARQAIDWDFLLDD